MAGTKSSGGRNAKGAAVHMLRGTFRPDRHADAVTPELPVGTPVPPKELTGDALAEWQRMVARLEQMGILSVVDDAALYQAARLFAETEADAERQSEVAASVEILEANLNDLDGDGKVACFQEISKMRQLEASYGTKIRQGRMAMRQFLVEFGLTPAARSRVKAPSSKPKVDPLAVRFLGRAQ